MTMVQMPAEPVGALLRRWRERRRLTQLDLSLRADVSARHLSHQTRHRSPFGMTTE